MHEGPRKPFDVVALAGCVTAMVVLVLATGPLLVSALPRAPGITVGVHAAAICSAASMMLRLRETAAGKWAVLAWVAAWIHCLVMIAQVLTPVPEWTSWAASTACAASATALCFAFGGLALQIRGRESAKGWRVAGVAAIGCWTVLLSVQAMWTPQMEAALKGSAKLLSLVAGGLVLGPGIAAIAAAGFSGLPAPFRGICTFCGYDMRSLSTRTCPECGRVGYQPEDAPPQPRRRLWKRLVPHYVAGVLVAGLLGLVLPNNELHRYKPLWLLMRECRLGPESFSSGGLVEGRGGFPPMWEIFKRADEGRFDQATARELADHALRVQADASAPLHLWPEVFAILDGQGLVTDEQRRAFEDHMAVYSLKLPASVSEGGHLPFTVYAASRGPSPIKTSTPVRDWSRSEPRLRAVFVDGVEVAAPARGADVVTQNWTSAHDFTAASSLPRMPMGPGKHRVRVELEVRTWINDGVKQSSTPEVKRTITLEGDVAFTPGAPAPVTRVSDPAAVRPLLEKWTWTYESYRLGGYKGREGIAIAAPDDAPALSFSVIADVVIEYKGKEYPLGRLVLKPGERSGFIANTTGWSWEPDFLGDVLPLVIRSTRVEFESGLSSVWDGPEQRVNAKFRDPPPKRD